MFCAGNYRWPTGSRNRRPAGSRIDSGEAAENGPRGDPTVDAPPVVADLESPALDRLDEVEVFGTAYSTKDDVAHVDVGWVDRLDRAKLPGFDL